LVTVVSIPVPPSKVIVSSVLTPSVEPVSAAILIAVVIFIFSLVLNRYFLKPIKNLVNYTENIKEKSKKKIDIKSLIKRKKF